LRKTGIRGLGLLVLLLAGAWLCSCGSGINLGQGTPEELPERPGWGLVVMGDSRGGADVLLRLAMIVSLLDPRPELTVHLGDMISRPGDEFQWGVFHEVMEPITEFMPLYPVPGNHDVEGGKSQDIYRQQFNLPGGMTYYRVDVNNARLLFLDGTIPGQKNSIAGEQLVWLEDQMTQLAGDTAFKLVFCHYPFFKASSSSHEPLMNAADLHALFVAAGVQAVFSSHDHLYDHQVHDGIDYFISGGGGAPPEGGEGSFYHFVLVSVDRDYLWVDVINLAGEVYDTVMIGR